MTVAESTDVSMNTICSDIGSQHNWPNDDVNCYILLGIFNDNITLIPDEENFFKVIVPYALCLKFQ